MQLLAAGAVKFYFVQVLLRLARRVVDGRRALAAPYIAASCCPTYGRLVAQAVNNRGVVLPGVRVCVARMLGACTCWLGITG